MARAGAGGHQAFAVRHANARKPSLVPALCLLALSIALPCVLTIATFVQGGSGPAVSNRGDAVARRASMYYSNKDRERLAIYRDHMRKERRERPRPGPTVPSLNYDMLPSIEDIYNREYTGNASADPIGGRKRWTFFLLLKNNPSLGATGRQKVILQFIAFLQKKMSCLNITGQLMKSPIDGAPVVTMEYPMKEYGEIPRDKITKEKYTQGYMVRIDCMAPGSALEYISRRVYSDNNILRWMVIGHTRTFKHRGEDNELHL